MLPAAPPQSGGSHAAAVLAVLRELQLCSSSLYQLSSAAQRSVVTLRRAEAGGTGGQYRNRRCCKPPAVGVAHCDHRHTPKRRLAALFLQRCFKHAPLSLWPSSDAPHRPMRPFGPRSLCLSIQLHSALCA